MWTRGFCSNDLTRNVTNCEKSYDPNSILKSARVNAIACLSLLLLLLPVVAKMSIAVEEKVWRDKNSDEHVNAQILACPTHVIYKYDKLHPTYQSSIFTHPNFPE